MKHTTLLLMFLLAISLSYACTIESINTSGDNFFVNDNITVNVIVSGDCSNYSINVYSVDLMNLEEETIYDGKITSNQMEFTTKTTEPTVKKIYANTYTNNVTKKLNKTKDTIKYTPIVTTIDPTKLYTLFESSRGVFDPETYEYGQIDINLRAYNQSGGNRTTSFGFYFLNNDFNITFLPGDFTSCTKLDGYPYSCEFPTYTFPSGAVRYSRVRLTNFKYNDVIFTFGQDGPVLYDLNKPIFAKPFITVKDWNVTNDILNVDFNIYNFNDINYCSLIVNGEEKQRNYTIELDNQFNQDINSGDNIIDINCFTPMNHYTYPSPRYDPIYAQPQPNVDNVLVSLSEPIFFSRSEFDDGNGSLEDPYKLNNCSELQLLENYSSSNFVLNQDIDCTDFDFEPINNFNGVFDGNGRLIQNLTINKPEQNNVGLFSTLDGNVKRIGLENIQITGNNNVGGLAGTNNGTIEESYVAGEINGNNYVGGITGINNRIETNDGFPYNGTNTNNDILKEIKNSYSIVNVFGNNAGGITGYNYGKLTNVYSLGAINGVVTGGLAGTNYTRCYPYTHSIRTGIINDSFSTIESAYANSCYSNWYYGSGNLENGEIVNTIVNSDLRYLRDTTNPPFNKWDFDKIWKKANDDGKKLASLKNYLALAWEDKVIEYTDFSEGSGTIEDPYKITDCTELTYIYDYPDSNFVLENDIDCTGVSVTPIEDFAGNFNGNGKKIMNLVINFPQKNNVGLFATLKGNVTKLVLEEVNITGNINVGGLAGTNDGNISECFVSGNINGEEIIGGIVGTNQRTTIIDQNSGKTTTIQRNINDSYTMVNLTGNNAGGISGYNYGTITNTYTTNTNGAGITYTNYTNCREYTHDVDSGIIQNSFSLNETAINNSCKSYWYMGSTTTEYGTITNTIVNPDITYLTDNNQQPFLTWDFDTTWKMDGVSKKALEIETYPILQWE